MKQIQVWAPRIFLLVTCVVLALAVGYAFLPGPENVEVRPVRRGLLLVTVDEDGITRVQEKYVVSAPLPGRLSRVQLHAGDPVEAGKTLLTNFDPTAPTLLDARARAEAEARLKVAEASRQRCDPIVERARVTVKFAEEEFERAKLMHERKSVSHEEMDRAELRFRAATEDVKAAQFATQIADHELELARAAMVHANRANDSEDTDAEDWRIQIVSPIQGHVLRVFQESSAVVPAGTPLMEVGDLRRLEIVVDVLSSDAVKITAGDSVLLEEWGGDDALNGRVRLVEPSGFTKISALGVEEQRVNVIVDLMDDFDQRRSLGDNFRVEARIIVDRADQVLTVPNGALFRDGDQYAVFVVENGRAKLRHVKVGRRGKFELEVTEGLVESEKVIVYPTDKVHDGVAISER
jgi:HlyD family secretion protein